MPNQKIKNAKSKTFDGIKFKSLLEISVYKALTQAGFKPRYEKQKFIIWKGFKPSVPFYNRNKRKNTFEIEKTKIRDITYTPDFTFKYKNYLIIIEAKGIENDTFPIKKKLFRSLLETLKEKALYFEVYNKAHILKTIEIIKGL